MNETLYELKITGKHGADYADRFEVYPNEPLLPSADPDGRFIAVQKLKTFTRLTLNDVALKDFIEDCAYYIECVGGDGEHGMAASARAALRQLMKQGFGDQVVEFTRGYQINF